MSTPSASEVGLEISTKVTRSMPKSFVELRRSPRKSTGQENVVKRRKIDSNQLSIAMQREEKASSDPRKEHEHLKKQSKFFKKPDSDTDGSPSIIRPLKVMEEIDLANDSDEEESLEERKARRGKDDSKNNYSD